MKRKIIVCLIICLGLCLVGCEKKSNEASKNETTLVDQFEETLKDKNISFEKITVKNPQTGLKNLYYYYLDDDSVLELYVFDVQSDLYQFAKENGYIENQEISDKIYLTINNDLGLTFDNSSIYRNTITEIFNNLK